MKKAFTLVEVVVAIGVLMVGVLGVASFFAYSVKIARSASNTSIATNLAQGLIEEESSKSYDELTPQTGAKTDYTSNADSPFNKFQEQINISLIDTDLNESETDIGLKKIEVIIYYHEGNSEKNVQMATVKASR